MALVVPLVCATQSLGGVSSKPRNQRLDKQMMLRCQVTDEAELGLLSVIANVSMLLVSGH